MMAAYDPDLHHRRSLRLRDYDYTQTGAYFVTIVVHNRVCLFGDVDGTGMRLNDAGNMVAATWNSLRTRFVDIDLDAFIVMPNHIHGIIVICPVVDPVGAPLVGAPAMGGRSAAETTATGAPTRVAPTATSLGTVVGTYKSLTTVEFTRGVKTLGWPAFTGRLWQRNYYEHIIRDEAALNLIRQYITDNPSRWADDPENPNASPAV